MILNGFLYGEKKGERNNIWGLGSFDVHERS